MNTTITLPDPVQAEQILSGWDFPLDAKADDIVAWAEAEVGAGYTVGMATLKAKLASPLPDVAAMSEPQLWAFLRTLVQARHDNFRPKRQAEVVAQVREIVAGNTVSTVRTEQAIIERQLDAHARRRSARDEADGNIQAAAAASMAPAGIPKFDSEELVAAMAVVERFGRFNEDGGFVTSRAHTIDAEAQRLLAKFPQRDYDMHYQWVKEKWFDLTLPQAGWRLGGGKVTLDFEYRPAGEYAPAGTESLIFVAMPTGSAAYQRGERVWVLSYCAPTFIDNAGKVREAFNQPGYRRTSSEDGLLGCVATFDSLSNAKDALLDLKLALGTIRRAGRPADEAESFRSRQFEPPTFGGQDMPY